MGLYKNIVIFFSLLTIKQNYYILILLFVMILSGSIELIALASVIPFISIISDPNVVNSDNAYYINYVISKFNIDSINAINLFALIFIGFFILSNIFIATTQSLIIFTTNRIEKITITKLFSYYLGENYLFHVNKNSALLIKNIEKEVSRFADAVFSQFLEIISKSIVTIFIFIGLMFVNVKSTLIIMAAFLLIYFILIMLIKRIFLIYGDIISDAYNARIKLINESLSGIKLLKFYKIELFFNNFFLKINQTLYNTVLKYRIISIWPKYIIESILVISIISTIIYNINHNPDYLELIPTATFFLLAGYRLLPMLQSIFNNFGSIRVNIAAWKSIRYDLNQSLKFSDLEEINSSKITFKNDIKMNDISYEYSQGSRVLNNVSVLLEKNKIIGLTGASGSGKTTLMDILSGLLDLQEGKIIVDGLELNSRERRNFTSVIGYVPQETFLMDDSIINNIILEKKQNIDQNKIENVCKKLGLYDFIMNLPENFKYSVGENAIRFSGGQKQRLGIARALYRDSQVLIFDEPTSSLDKDNEEKFMRLIKELSKDVTIIIISHSMNLKNIFDKTYFFSKGKLKKI